MYNFDETVNRYGTESVKYDLYGPDVLPMWVADMDFKTAPEVLEVHTFPSMILRLGRRK